MIFNAQDDVFAGNIQDFLYLAHIIVISMFRAGGKTDAWFVELTGLGHLFKNRLHVGDVVHEVECSPDIYVLGKFTNRQPDDILGIGTVAKQVYSAAQSLEHGVRHCLAQQFQLEKRVQPACAEYPHEPRHHR